jgi:hypothetical protein
MKTILMFSLDLLQRENSFKDGSFGLILSSEITFIMVSHTKLNLKNRKSSRRLSMVVSLPYFYLRGVEQIIRIVYLKYQVSK